MPNIKPFKGVHPCQEYVDQVVLQVEDLSLDKANEIRSHNPYSYLNMLVPVLEHLFLRGSRQEILYKKINENFEDFLEKGILVKDVKSAIYVYQISKDDLIQTGVWATTSIDDYLNNTVKRHELTRAEREKGLVDYLQQTGIDANPVLITYLPVLSIQTLIYTITSKKPELSFLSDQVVHQLWKVDDEERLDEFIKAFGAIQTSYIADGHHRAAAASVLGMQRRKLNLNHTGSEAYNFFNSVYMSTDQLQIFEFNRLVKDIGGFSVTHFLNQIRVHFEIEILLDTEVFRPRQLHEFGLYLDQHWYRLSARSRTYARGGLVESLDVTILQNYILSPILHIMDPRIDPRLSFVGGITPLEVSVQRVDQGDYAAFFTLFPTSIEQLIQAADAGEIMPPKSTWFEPKFQVGLVIHQL